MRPLPPAEHDGLESARITFEWPHATIAQRYRLLQTTPSPRFWASDWRFYADGAPTSLPRRRPRRRPSPPATLLSTASPRPGFARSRLHRGRVPGGGARLAAPGVLRHRLREGDRGGPVLLRAILPRAGVRGGRVLARGRLRRGDPHSVHGVPRERSAKRRGARASDLGRDGGGVGRSGRRRDSAALAAAVLVDAAAASARGACSRRLRRRPPPRRCRPPQRRREPRLARADSSGCSSRPVGGALGAAERRDEPVCARRTTSSSVNEGEVGLTNLVYNDDGSASIDVVLPAMNGFG